MAESAEPATPVDRRTRGVWIGLMLTLGGAFVRAVCPSEPFPWWEADPFRFAPPIAGLTPVWGLAVDGVVLIGAAVVLACSRRGLGPLASALLAIALAVVGWHAATQPETASHGASLAAGVAAIAAVWGASATPGVRRVALGVALGFGVMLAVTGAQEVFVEHPRTVGSFEQTRESFYLAKGWDPAGPEAAMYEERLSHADPTAAFGLTNVLATFAGASAVGLLATALSGGWSRAARLAMVAGATASGWVLLATGSKGGIGAAALGGLTVAIVSRVRPAWVGRAAFGASVGVLLAVAARGLVGERLGELSLLFRSQYQRGTLAIWAEHPIFGVGPGLYQDAYTRLKPLGAPEDVTSAHAVFFDWVGVLGLGGLALIGFLAVGWLPKRSAETMPSTAGPPKRTLARMVGGVIATCVIATAGTTRQTLGLEGAGALVVGSVGWGALGIWIAAGRGRIGVAAVAGGAVALIHAQLDVTAVWAVSAPAWGVLIGCGVGAIGGRDTGRIRWLTVGMLGLLVAVLGWRGTALARWEAGLDRAAAWAVRIAEVRLAAQVEGDAGLARAADTAGEWLGIGVPARADAVEAALETASLLAQDEAAEGLREALRARPTHTGTRSALGRVLVVIGTRDQERDPASAARAWSELIEVSEAGPRLTPWDAGAWSWLGRAYERRARVADRAGEWLAKAVDAWEQADRLTPQDPGSAARLAGALAEMGRSNDAVAWAGEALVRDDALVLDPKRRLATRERAAMERLARGVP